MLSDSGNITMVDFSLEKENEVVFKVVLNEGYQKSGLRRVSVNEHLIVDIHGRFVICGAVE